MSIDDLPIAVAKTVTVMKTAEMRERHDRQRQKLSADRQTHRGANEIGGLFGRHSAPSGQNSHTAEEKESRKKRTKSVCD